MRTELVSPTAFMSAHDPSRSRFTVRKGAHVAQLAEHVLGKDEVTRSIRVVGSSSSVMHDESEVVG
jgi:hypothetical protein